MNQEPMQQGGILLYDNGGQKEFVSVVFRGETFWLTQKVMVQPFPKWKQFRRRADEGFAVPWITTIWIQSLG